MFKSEISLMLIEKKNGSSFFNNVAYIYFIQNCLRKGETGDKLLIGAGVADKSLPANFNSVRTNVVCVEIIAPFLP